MYDIKAHEVVYRGAHFRSKNECKRYIFLKQLGWNVEYEPVLEDIKGWLPDMVIFGKSKKILVEVKPFQILKDFSTEYAKETYTKIHRTEWWNNYDAVLIFGASLNLGEADCDDTFLGGYIFRTDDHIKKEPKDKWPKINSFEEKRGPYWSDNFVYTTRDVPEGHVDVCDHIADFSGIVHDSYDGGYFLKEADRIKIETAWNYAGSEMRYVRRVA